MCLFHCAICGLKQSSSAWFEKFSHLLSTIGFCYCSVYPTVRQKITSGGIGFVLVVHVDAIFLTRSHEVRIFTFKAHLRQLFVTRNTGTLRYFLGIKFAYQLG